ncbi:MAG TPA: PKD domain-containing protein, partial [Gemmataceae bacterium]|nr:PKD domain-containing protein [Gemmataceae bacterium]
MEGAQHQAAPPSRAPEATQEATAGSSTSGRPLAGALDNGWSTALAAFSRDWNIFGPGAPVSPAFGAAENAALPRLAGAAAWPAFQAARAAGTPAWTMPLLRGPDWHTPLPPPPTKTLAVTPTTHQTVIRPPTVMRPNPGSPKLPPAIVPPGTNGPSAPQSPSGPGSSQATFTSDALSPVMPASRVRPYSQGGPSTITINSLGVSGVTEGAAFTGNPLATFNDSDGNTLASAYTVNVDWGDGNRATLPTSDITSTGGGNFKVTAGHTYAEEGAFTLKLTVTDLDGKSASQSTTESVADAALTNLSVSAINASTGLRFSGEIATFSDTDPAGQASDYSATINWGDGSSNGTVTGAGPFVVSGTHTYTAVGTYTVSVTVTDHGGASISGSNNGTVKGISPTFQSFAPTEGQNPA